MGLSGGVTDVGSEGFIKAIVQIVVAWVITIVVQIACCPHLQDKSEYGCDVDEHCILVIKVNIDVT